MDRINLIRNQVVHDYSKNSYTLTLISVQGLIIITIRGLVIIKHIRKGVILEIFYT